MEQEAAIVDGQGMYLVPGFIDLHVHGGGGADFMDATVDAFETAVKAHLKHGTTSIAPTTLAAPIDQLKRVVLSIKKASEEFVEIANKWEKHKEIAIKYHNYKVERPALNQ